MSDESSDVDSNELIDLYQGAEWFGFDTENDETGKVTLAALVSESGEHTIWQSAGNFMEWADKRCRNKQKTIIICHNLEYDLINEFGVENYAKMVLSYLKGRLISAKMGYYVKFLDSFNHFRMSLAEIGESIGIFKQEMDIYNPEYVKQDAWICLKVMTQARDYIASLGGKLGATSGSSALSIWSFMTDSEFFTGPFDTPWLRKGYYGGRTEIFRKLTESPMEIGWDFGKYGRPTEAPLRSKLIRGYDINSMYPFSMLNDFPEYHMPDDKIDKAKGMAEVTIKIPRDLVVAPLCYRSVDGSLLYPVGLIRGVWTYDEIRLAESLGAQVLRVHKAYGCNSLVRPFDGFIKKLYAKRKLSTNSSEKLFLKVLMNALYGKIASRNTVTRTVSRYHLLKTNSKRMNEVKWISYHRGLLDYFVAQPAYVNVLWGSMITAYSRILLTNYMLKVPPEKLIYCDTDSVYVYDHELPTSNELGAMKLEKMAGVMKVVQPKAYMIDDFYRAKGVPRPREDENGITIDFARQYIDHGYTAFMAPIRFRASLNSHRGKANEWVQHKKSIKSGYTAKRLSGNSYYPPVVGAQMELDLSGTTKG